MSVAKLAEEARDGTGPTATRTSGSLLDRTQHVDGNAVNAHGDLFPAKGQGGQLVQFACLVTYRVRMLVHRWKAVNRESREVALDYFVLINLDSKFLFPGLTNQVDAPFTLLLLEEMLRHGAHMLSDVESPTTIWLVCRLSTRLEGQVMWSDFVVTKGKEKFDAIL